MQKRGLSDVVTTVLIILLVLASVVIVWNFLQPFLKNANSIDTQKYSTKLSVDENTISLDPNENLLSLYVGRDAGDGDIQGFIFGLQDPAGVIRTFRQNMTLYEYEKKNLTINYSEFLTDDIVSVTITPIFRSNTTGKEVLGFPITQPVKNKTFKIPSGLVAHWRMDGTWNDAKSGLAYVSSSSSTNAAFDTQVKKIGSASGKFDGSQLVTVANNPLLNLEPASPGVQDGFTIIAWVRVTGTDANPLSILKRKALTTGYALSVISPGKVNFKVNSVSITTTNINLNEWTFIAARYTPNNPLEIFKNSEGPVSSTASVTYAPSSLLDLTFGDSQYGFRGNIDEVMLYNISLTNDEINSIRSKYTR